MKSTEYNCGLQAISKITKPHVEIVSYEASTNERRLIHLRRQNISGNLFDSYTFLF